MSVSIWRYVTYYKENKQNVNENKNESGEKIVIYCYEIKLIKNDWNVRRVSVYFAIPFAMEKTVEPSKRELISKTLRKY